MIYIDTSSLLKLVISDEHSSAVEKAIMGESVVLVSSLTALEAQVQLRALSRSGKMNPGEMNQTRKDLAEILGFIPFVSRPLKGTVFSDALHRHIESAIHCRSLDRLHLAAMAELGVSRLMTHDGRQADGAKELGFEVLMPGLE
jgi:predicted nucleic acid-binding protein